MPNDATLDATDARLFVPIRPGVFLVSVVSLFQLVHWLLSFSSISRYLNTFSLENLIEKLAVSKRTMFHGHVLHTSHLVSWFLRCGGMSWSRYVTERDTLSCMSRRRALEVWSDVPAAVLTRRSWERADRCGG